MYIPGLDLSRHNVSFSATKAANNGIKVVIPRFTVGDYYTDNMFSDFYLRSERAGMLTTIYWVVAPMAYMGGPKITPDAQYDYLREQGDKHKLDLSHMDIPIVMDCELARTSDQGWVEAVYFKISENLVRDKIPFMIYTNANFGNKYLYDSYWSKFPLLVANYTTAAQPWLPRAWSKWVGWQYTSTASAPDYGVGGTNLDLHRWDPEYIEPGPAPIPPVELPEYIEQGSRVNVAGVDYVGMTVLERE